MVDHSMLAFLLWQSLVVPSLLQLCEDTFVSFAVHKTCSIFVSPFISKASTNLSSFFLNVQLSQPYVATGHTSTLFSRIFVEINTLQLFHIFCSAARLPALCMFNQVWNSVIHLPSSLIKDPTYGNVFTCSSCHSEWVWMTLYLYTLCRRSPLLWSCQRWCKGKVPSTQQYPAITFCQAYGYLRSFH